MGRRIRTCLCTYISVRIAGQKFNTYDFNEYAYYDIPFNATSVHSILTFIILFFFSSFHRHQLLHSRLFPSPSFSLFPLSSYPPIFLSHYIIFPVSFLPVRIYVALYGSENGEVAKVTNNFATLLEETGEKNEVICA